jgi:1-acyl-sn-glycerol-3-phosphate acyltransferase
MGDRLYRAIRWFGAPFRFHALGLEHLPAAGPAIYVANHSASVGPVQCILSLPIRAHPWIRAEMWRYDQAPAYLYDDFVAPELGVRGRLGLALSWAICRIALPLIHGIGCVPVDRNQGLFDASMAQSLELLRQGRSLLIFPEDNLQPLDQETQMYPFGLGYAWLAFRYARTVGRSVPVYPIALWPEAKLLQVGKPLYLELHSGRKTDVRHFGAQVEAQVRQMCRELQGQATA